MRYWRRSLAGRVANWREVAARRRRRRRLIEDVLLLPLALVLVFLEYVVWDGTHALLDLISKAPPVARLRARLQTLPPAVVLFLFLIPEAIDHLGGFWATMLLVKRHLVGATLVAVFVKGSAALIAIWIYQACEPSLLSVRWFAWLHHRVIAAKNWVFARTEPLVWRLRDVIRRRLHGPVSGRLRRRLVHWRLRLAGAFGLVRR